MKNLQQIIRGYGSKTTMGTCCNSNPLMKEWMFGEKWPCGIPPLFANHNQDESTSTITHSIHNNHPYTLQMTVLATVIVANGSTSSTQIYYGDLSPYFNNPFQLAVNNCVSTGLISFTVNPGDKVWFHHVGQTNQCYHVHYHCIYSIDGTDCNFEFDVNLQSNKHHC